MNRIKYLQILEIQQLFVIDFYCIVVLLFYFLFTKKSIHNYNIQLI